MKLVYSFDVNEIPEIEEVGGKGLSLILMTRESLPVPPGFILSASFFTPWFEQLKKSPAWERFTGSSPESLHEDCRVLKEEASQLPLNKEQRGAIDEALEVFAAKTGSKLFAIRSSSPEEDLEGASFAGGYETVLGVTGDTLTAAVTTAFISCLDERVFLYKKEHGFDAYDPKIAVVIQQQVASDTAGVAFSLNPLNNCYDEAVINANYGLGESVVSGHVSPDQYVVDKASSTILKKQVGRKETSVWVNGYGGTSEKPAPDRGGFCLTDEQVITLTGMTSTVEKYYKKPMDIEWAFAGGRLFLLQARPITAYIPLPEEMLTLPGERRMLYMDMFLIKQGIKQAFSVFGLDLLEQIQLFLLDDLMGTRDVVGLEAGMFINLGGRSYTNLSTSLKVQGKKLVSASVKTQDMLAYKIIQGIDEKEYVVKKTPKPLKGLIFKVLKKNFGSIKSAMRAYKKPDEYHSYFKEETKKIRQILEEELIPGNPLKETTLNVIEQFCYFVNHISLPLSYAAEMARSKLKKLFIKAPQDIRDKIVYLEQALPNNVTIEMGLELFKLAAFPDIAGCRDGVEFSERLKNRSLSAEFLKAWDHYIKMYGHRCPVELDAASPRFYDKPVEAFNQLWSLAQNSDEHCNPQTIYNEGIIRRETMTKLLRDSLGNKSKVKKFDKCHKVLVAFGAYREIHKYYTILLLDRVRKMVLALADQWVSAGRLANREDVFNLRLEEIDRAVDTPALDLKTTAAKNTVYLNKVKHFYNYPRIIDSRGKILHAPKKEAKEGEVAGEPISPGIVRGKVKILHTPDEKPLLPGEILVTRATDPGWTPLFLNAGGIVLEVGGLLQHGALVAREYCKPCVAGIEDVTSLFADGQEIEIDGTGGIIRIV